jgi:hypothetical protein
MTSESQRFAEQAVTLTLEFSIDGGAKTGIMHATPDEVQGHGFGMAVFHMRREIAEHLDPLPLCWVIDGERRGGTVELWEVSFDHETLPSFALIDHQAYVTCDDCKEWIHA